MACVRGTTGANSCVTVANASRATTLSVFRMSSRRWASESSRISPSAPTGARHARMFFNSPDFELDDAVAGSFGALRPPTCRSC